METRIEIIKRYLEEDPGDIFLRYALAMEFIGVNNYKEAGEILENLVADDPSYLAAYYMAGKSFELQGEYAKAKRFYISGMQVARMKNENKTYQELEAALGELDD